MTRKDYDVEHLIGLLKGLKERYPNLQIILEPGSAFTWQTGPLVASVVDVVESKGIGRYFGCQLYMPYAGLSGDAVSAGSTWGGIFACGCGEDGYTRRACLQAWRKQLLERRLYG